MGRVVRVSEITMDLITDEATGKVSAPKLAAATGHFVGTFFFCWFNFKGPFNMQLWLLYYGVVVGHMSVETWLQQRPGLAGGKGAPTPESEPAGT